MYLWNSEKIITQLSEDAVSEWEATKYLILVSAFSTITGAFYYDPLNRGLVDWFGSAILVVIVIIGISYCFKVNQQGDNKNFIIRYVVLTWPVLIRIILFTIIPYLIILIIAYRSELSISLLLLNEWFRTFYTFLIEILYFYLLSNYIKRVSHTSLRSQRP